MTTGRNTHENKSKGTEVHNKAAGGSITEHRTKKHKTLTLRHRACLQQTDFARKNINKISLYGSYMPYMVQIKLKNKGTETHNSSNNLRMNATW